MIVDHDHPRAGFALEQSSLTKWQRLVIHGLFFPCEISVSDLIPACSSTYQKSRSVGQCNRERFFD
jgi:hypothetical protein